MNKRNLALAITMGLSFANGVFAADPETEKEEFDVNSVSYIQEEVSIDLGFDVADYLPEGFDPHKYYVDLNSIKFIENNEVLDIDTAAYLPEGFDAYSDPKGIEGVNYIDENETFSLGFNAQAHLPEAFNPYAKK